VDDAIAKAVEEELLSKHATVWGQAFDVIGQRLDDAVGYYAPFVEAVMRRLLPLPPRPDWPRHVVLGLDPEEWERIAEAGRKKVAWMGMRPEQDPRYHGHPDLGIEGHAHNRVEIARAPHTHRLVVSWDHEPIPLDEG
jgi:hypothetical protein